MQTEMSHIHRGTEKCFRLNSGQLQWQQLTEEWSKKDKSEGDSLERQDAALYSFSASFPNPRIALQNIGA